MKKKYIQISNSFRKVVQSCVEVAGIMFMTFPCGAAESAECNPNIEVDSTEYVIHQSDRILNEESLNDLNIGLRPIDLRDSNANTQKYDTLEFKEVTSSDQLSGYNNFAPEAIEEGMVKFAGRSGEDITVLDPLKLMLMTGLEEVKVVSAIVDGSAEDGILSVTLSMPGNIRISLIADKDDDLIGLNIFDGRDHILSDYMPIEDISSFILNAQRNIG